MCLRTASVCPGGPGFPGPTLCVCVSVPPQGLCPGLRASAPPPQPRIWGPCACAVHARRQPSLPVSCFQVPLPVFPLPCVLRHFPPGGLRLLLAQAARCRRVFQAPCTSGRTPLTHLLQASAADLACRPLLGVGGHQGDRFRAQILHLCVTPPERPPCRFQLSPTLSCRQ